MKRFLVLAAIIAGWLLCAGASRAQSGGAPPAYRYLSPVPGASYVPAQTRYILVRFAQIAPSAVTNLANDFITVTAATSGPHSGSARIASDGRTVIFELSSGFINNELVTVNLNPLVQPGTVPVPAPFQFQFMITAPMPGSFPLAVRAPGLVTNPPAGATKGQNPLPQANQKAAGSLAARKALTLANGVSVPSDFPQVVITANNAPSPGYLFLENAVDVSSPYTMMLDNSGAPIWYRRGRMFDFKTQDNGVLTWGSYDSNGAVFFTAADQNFHVLKIYTATNGYQTDPHEFKLLPDGSYFLIGTHVNAVDMSLYTTNGGMGSVVESVIQGFTASDELIFQWRAWDNYDIRDLWPPGNTDFPHMNGVDVDDDNNIVISARHLSEVTKIDRDSGAIIWRLSGAHSTFSFPNDSINGTSYQHNVSALGNGHYLVFDNGDYHSFLQSRVVEYQLNLTNLTASLVWQFVDPSFKYAWYCGSAQRLPTGNTFIDFVLASYPKATEVDSNGVKRFELSLVPSSDSYRAFRFPWNGVLATPYLIVEPQSDNITLVFNKFGDSHVAYYRVYGGPSPAPTTLLTESSTTTTRLSNLPSGLYYFRVTAVSTDGTESPFSNEENLNVNIIAPGQNIIQNGDFSKGLSSWRLNLNGAGSAGWYLENGAGHFYITNGGTSVSSVQLLQGGVPLVHGKQYVLQFDAWSSQTRYIDVHLAQSVPPALDYSQITAPFLTPNKKHYRYIFSMKQASDFSANLVFNLGTSDADVFLQNISLFTPPVGDLNLDGRVDLLDLSVFCESWLKQQPSLPADLNGDGKVDFTDFSTFGANWTPGGP